MASITSGEILGYRAPVAGETVRLPVLLLDTSGEGVLGVTYDEVTLEVGKEGGAPFVPFSLTSENWYEVGRGNYDVVLRGDVPAEAALFDTAGALRIYAQGGASRGDTFLFKVNTADVARLDVWTPQKANYLTGPVALEATLTAMKGEGWTTETLRAIYAAVMSSSGSGAHAVDLRILDELDAAVLGYPFFVYDAQGTRVGIASPGDDGWAHFNLDRGAYTMRPPSSSSYLWGETGVYSFTVMADAQFSFEAATLELPVSTDPLLCAVYDDFRWLEGGGLVGAREGSMVVRRLLSPVFPEAEEGEASTVVEGTKAFTNALGRVSLDLIRGSRVEILLECGGSSRLVAITVPDQASAYLPELIEANEADEEAE